MRNVKKPLIFSSLILLLTLELLACPVTGAYGSTEDGEKPIFQKGMSYSAWSPDAFSSSDSDESLRLLTETNTEWIVVNFAWVQTNITSHDIHIDADRTPTTDSVRHAIATAHSLDLKVMLKPMVDLLEEENIQEYPTVWRGDIQPSDEWFESYSSFINSFAEFAEENDVELFSVGCELNVTTREKEQWESVIAGVRERYSGPITYAADWTNYKNIEWWGSVDYVGIDAYFPLTFEYDPSFEELKNAWISYADEIETWVSTVDKPVIFTEIGYRSGDGTNMAPSNYWSEMDVDLQEQRDCYEAAFQALWNRSWFYGFYWWTWISDPEKGGASDSNHTPQWKPAQNVVTSWYSLDRKVAVIGRILTSSNRCSVNTVQWVGFHVSWEDDDIDVADARVYVNGTEYETNETGWTSFTVSIDTVDKRSWVVTDFQHPEATAYKITVENPSIIWDQVVDNAEVDSAVMGLVKVAVKVTYAFDKTSVTGATTFVNGDLCEEVKPGVYEIEIDSWSPYNQLTIHTHVADFPEVTLATSSVHFINLIFYVAIVVAIIVIVLIFLIYRKHSSRQIIEEMDEVD